MSDSNVELVRRAMEAFGRRDLETLEKLCDPDVEIDWSRRLLDPEVIHGFDDLRRFFEEIAGIFEEIVFDEEEIVDFGDEVLLVSTARFRGRNSGVEVTARGANVWTLRDGKLARFRFYQSKQDAFDDLQRPAVPTAEQAARAAEQASRESR